MTSLQTQSFLASVPCFIFFEDNEAVIKMIIDGRSPTMRHLTRTQIVALDRLLDRMNLDRKIQIKYVDTRNQLDDILTKGSFARDEWNHFLCQVQHHEQFHIFLQQFEESNQRPSELCRRGKCRNGNKEEKTSAGLQNRNRREILSQKLSIGLQQR